MGNCIGINRRKKMPVRESKYHYHHAADSVQDLAQPPPLVFYYQTPGSVKNALPPYELSERKIHGSVSAPQSRITSGGVSYLTQSTSVPSSSSSSSLGVASEGSGNKLKMLNNIFRTSKRETVEEMQARVQHHAEDLEAQLYHLDGERSKIIRRAKTMSHADREKIVLPALNRIEAEKRSLANNLSIAQRSLQIADQAEFSKKHHETVNLTKALIKAVTGDKPLEKLRKQGEESVALLDTIGDFQTEWDQTVNDIQQVASDGIQQVTIDDLNNELEALDDTNEDGGSDAYVPLSQFPNAPTASLKSHNNMQKHQEPKQQREAVAAYEQ